MNECAFRNERIGIEGNKSCGIIRIQTIATTYLSSFLFFGEQSVCGLIDALTSSSRGQETASGFFYCTFNTF